MYIRSTGNQCYSSIAATEQWNKYVGLATSRGAQKRPTTAAIECNFPSIYLTLLVLRFCTPEVLTYQSDSIFLQSGDLTSGRLIMMVGVKTYVGISFGLHIFLIGRINIYMCWWRNIYIQQNIIVGNGISLLDNIWIHDTIPWLYFTVLNYVSLFFVSLRYCMQHPYFDVSLFSGNSFHEYCIYTFLIVSMWAEYNSNVYSIYWQSVHILQLLRLNNETNMLVS